MRISLRPAVSVFFVLVLVATVLARSVQTANPTLDGNLIAQKCLTNWANAAAYLNTNFVHKEVETIEKFGVETGKPLFRKVRVYETRFSNGKLYRRLLEENGVAKLNERFKPVKVEIAIEKFLLDRFDYTFQESKVVGGRPLAVLTFIRKKEIKTQTKTEYDEVINTMVGTIEVWLDDWSLSKLTGRISERVNFGVPLLGQFSVRSGEANFDTMMVAGRVTYKTIRADYIYKTTVLLSSSVVHEVRTFEYKDFEPIKRTPIKK